MKKTVIVLLVALLAQISTARASPIPPVPVCAGLPADEQLLCASRYGTPITTVSPDLLRASPDTGRILRACDDGFTVVTVNSNGSLNVTCVHGDPGTYPLWVYPRTTAASTSTTDPVAIGAGVLGAMFGYVITHPPVPASPEEVGAGVLRDMFAELFDWTRTVATGYAQTGIQLPRYHEPPGWDWTLTPEWLCAFSPHPPECDASYYDPDGGFGGGFGGSGNNGTPVPEPSLALLLFVAMALLAAWRGRFQPPNK